MSSLPLNHQVSRSKRVDAATARAVRLWRGFDPEFLDVSWDLLAPGLVASVSDAQVSESRAGQSYTDAVASFYGESPASARVVPEAFGGVTADGREIGPAMYGAVTQTKRAVGRGMETGRAFEVGAAFLATVVGAALQDAGRASDMVGAASKRWVQYIRVVNAGACSRCAVLAGRSYITDHFQRHPRCRCTMWPVASSSGANPTPAGLFESPEDYFESLSEAEQDRVFTKAGAWAIRNGADPISVVNARRGAYGIGYNAQSKAVSGASNRLRPVTIGTRADGSPLQVYATDEGATARGSWARAEGRRGAAWSKSVSDRYRRTTSIRLMPEQIMRMGKGNPERTVQLLKRYGYLS